MSAVTGARHPRLRSFLNFLLWYLGSVFVFLGLLVVGTSLVPNLSSSPRPLTGYGIIFGDVILVTIVAVRCKAGFWAAVTACVIGFAAMSLYLVISALIHIYLRNAKLVDTATLMKADQFAVVGCLVIGAALLLNRWFARRRRIAVEAATTAAVFD
jgi:hypothetical protein